MSAPAKKARIAWVALFAVLFSGLSATLAAICFSDRIDFLSEVCTVTGIKKIAASSDDGAHHSKDKDGNGVYCAHCLSSASAPVIETSPVVMMFAFVAGTQAMPGPAVAHFRPSPALPPPSRGPPATF